MAQRLTAGEWLQEVARILGGANPGNAPEGGVLPVRQVTDPHVEDQGSKNPSSIPFTMHAFAVTALQRVCQVIPTGYYDSILIGLAPTGATTYSYPLFVAIGSLNTTEAVYAMGMTQAAWAIAHPPIKAMPAQSNENYLELNVPMTNAPLLVWADDGINPSTMGGVSIGVALMTRRH